MTLLEEIKELELTENKLRTKIRDLSAKVIEYDQIVIIERK